MSSTENEWTAEDIARGLRDLRAITTDKKLRDLYAAAADRVVGPELSVDLERNTVVVDGHVVQLVGRETDIMEVLRQCRFVRHQALIAKVWGITENLVAPRKQLRVHIAKINHKLDETSYRVANQWGEGYELRRIKDDGNPRLAGHPRPRGDCCGRNCGNHAHQG